jgi:hypothetical protein
MNYGFNFTMVHTLVYIIHECYSSVGLNEFVKQTGFTKVFKYHSVAILSNLEIEEMLPPSNTRNFYPRKFQHLSIILIFIIKFKTKSEEFKLLFIKYSRENNIFLYTINLLDYKITFMY